MDNNYHGTHKSCVCDGDKCFAETSIDEPLQSADTARFRPTRLFHPLLKELYIMNVVAKSKEGVFASPRMLLHRGPTN
jgi:hypothetical protein